MKTRPSSKTLLLAVAGLLVGTPLLERGAARAQGAASSAAAQETQRINESLTRARDVQRLARTQAGRGEVTAATASYDYAIGLLEPNALTNPLLEELRRERAALGSGPSAGASDPVFTAERGTIDSLVTKGRSQYLAGDINGAEITFKDVETRDPTNAEAKNFLRRIAEARRDAGWLDREKTREQMLVEVTRSWQRPGVFQERQAEVETQQGPVPLLDKLNRITIPSVNFTGVELSRVVSTLSSISEEFDDTGVTPKGVNIVLIDPNRTNPAVNITLRNLTLRRVLDFITDSVGFQYEVQLDAVVVRPGGEITNLETDFFPVSRATVIRMVGATSSSGASAAASDPFAATAPAAGGVAGESESIRNFLQQAGVNFEGTQGASLVYDGAAMIVTQTSRNLSRIRNILNRYNDVRQVEIEAKFMDVSQGALDELGIDWRFTGSDGDTYRTSNRRLDQAFSPSTSSSNISITGTPLIPVQPPSFPGGANLGEGANPIGLIVGTLDNVGVDATIRALSQHGGTDLLSSPKVTVLSGNPAAITVAQEFRYPESYGDIESQVGQSSGLTGGGAAGVTITAGTPQDFKTRNVGVELSVTPTVEDDDYSISLDLNPRVTEFDGFVEYGGTSIAISSGTTVTVPSGFFQPIFSVREMRTKVAVWDGATIVMGGLTREEVKRVKDKVPILGDVPLVGRLFRSEGESNQKRNLLVFVTANLVSPGGSLKKQSVRGVTPNSLFQNPTIVTPGGSVDRTPRR